MNKFILGALGIAIAAVATQARAQITLSPFITSTQLDSIYGPGESSPIGIAYTGSGFVGTGGYYYTSPVLYQTNLAGTSISTFGSLAGESIGGEVVLSASPDGSSFGSNLIYSGSGGSGQIFKFASAGSSPTIFANVTSGDVRGISFDTTGLYGGNMIVTTTSGAVDEITSAGVTTQLAYLGTDTEGIGFATQKFGTFAAGTLFTASEDSEWVNAISPTGVVTPVFQIPEAESISFVPANISTETNPLEGFYGVNYPNDIEFAPAAQFDKYAGDVIVTTENSGYDPNIWAISLDSSDNATITGIGYMNQPEDSIFVTQESVVVHGGGVPDGGSAATMLFLGMLSLGALAYRRKSLNEGDPVALHKI